MDIRVKLTRKENAMAWDVGTGDVVTMPMEQYLCGVVGAEMGANAPPEALKAQAVAARTYALPYATEDKVITDDSSVHQAYKAPPAHWSDALAVVRNTWGQVLTYGGKPLKTCPFSASNGGRTVASGERWSQSLPYLIAQEDPWDAAERQRREAAGQKVTKGHGVGMSQYGAMWAARNGVTYAEILAFYYAGTSIAEDYGKGEVMKMSVSKPEMGVLIHTQNDCYKANKRRTPTRIIVHSTGANNPKLNRYAGPDDGVIGKNTYNNHWNRPGVEKCGNALIGMAADGTPMIYQTLDWDVRPWLSGKGPKGNGNDTAIQFEICQDFGPSSKPGTAKTWYWNAVRALAVHLCAWLCQEYGIAVDEIYLIDHQEARKLGIASNHGDIRNWQVLFGDNMDKFRADVQAMLDGGAVPTPAEPVEPPTTDEVIASAVQTGSSGLYLREGPGTGYGKLGQIPRGKSLDVYEIRGTWARVRYQNTVGWCSANFLTIDFLDIDAEEQEEKVIGLAVQTGSSGLNLREGPSTAHKSLGYIPRHTDLDVYEVRGTWARVQWGNIQGWCSAKPKYLTITYDSKQGECA